MSVTLDAEAISLHFLPPFNTHVNVETGKSRELSLANHYQNSSPYLAPTLEFSYWHYSLNAKASVTGTLATPYRNNACMGWVLALGQTF